MAIRAAGLDFYKVCKDYFPEFYDEEDVAIFVRRGKITPEEYEKITGVPYQ
ncbi:XkdX family protein [Bacillus cereus]|nr:XkdX family protein [Bacillus cereus]